MSLLSKAKKTKVKQLGNVNRELAELAIAWGKREVGFIQMREALGKAKGNGGSVTYSNLAFGFRWAIENGMLREEKGGIDISYLFVTTQA